MRYTYSNGDAYWRLRHIYLLNVIVLVVWQFNHVADYVIRWLSTSSFPRTYQPVDETAAPLQEPAVSALGSNQVSEWHIRIRHVKKILGNTALVLFLATLAVQTWLLNVSIIDPYRHPDGTCEAKPVYPDSLYGIEWLMYLIGCIGLGQALLYWVFDSINVHKNIGNLGRYWEILIPGVVGRRNAAGAIDALLELVKFILTVILVSYVVHCSQQIHL